MNTFSVIVVLLFLGSAQGILLSAALLKLRRGNVTANRILATLLAIYSFTIFFHTMAQVSGESSAEGWLGHAIFLLFGPLMFFYAKALTDAGFCLHLKDVIHVVPFAFVAGLYLFAMVVILQASSIHVINVSVLFIMVVQMVAYLVGVLAMLRNHTAHMRDNFSSIERVSLHWLRFLTIGQICIWSVAFFLELFKSDARAINFVWLLVSIFIYMVGYLAISQPEIFSGELVVDTRVGGRKKKYEKSSLSSDMAETLIMRLRSIMESDKPYLDSSLTLPALSKRLSISANHLSQVINEGLGKNFFEFVNEYRVNEAKLLLIDPIKQNLTLAAIGFEAGFNSVSSFNSIFKKQTAVTPSQYRSSTPRRSQQVSS